MWTLEIMPVKHCLTSNPPPKVSCSCRHCKQKSFNAVHRITFPLILLSLTYLSKDYRWLSDVWTSSEFPNWGLSIKPQLHQTRGRVPSWTSSVPHIPLVVLHLKVCAFTINNESNHILCRTLKYQEAIRNKFCRQWEEGMVSAEVCNGSVDIKDKLAGYFSIDVACCTNIPEADCHSIKIPWCRHQSHVSCFGFLGKSEHFTRQIYKTESSY